MSKRHWGIVPHLKKLFKKCRRTDHGRYDFYEYLDDIHRRVAAMSITKRTQEKRSISEEVLGAPPRKGASIFLILIKATASGEIRSHSRWARALQACDARKNRLEIEKVGFQKFVQKNGGISGLARRVADAQQVKDWPEPRSNPKRTGKGTRKGDWD